MGLKKAINLLARISEDPAFNSLEENLKSDINEELKKELKKQNSWGGY